MRWVAPSEKDTANQTLEKRLWAAADQFRANSGLKVGQYSTPVLGLIFLRFAEARFAKRRAELEKAGGSARRGMSRIDDPKAYMAEGVLFLTPSARFDYLLQRPEGSNVGRAVNEAMADMVSPGQNEIEQMKKLGLDIVPHRKRMNEQELDEKFKTPDDPLRLVFLCAMWLTGFDAPSCSTIYLDKPMRTTPRCKPSRGRTAFSRESTAA